MSVRFVSAAALLLAGLIAVTAARAQTSAPCPGPCPACRNQGRPVMQAYEVAGLVVPIPSCQATSGEKARLANVPATRENELIALIQKTVAPRSWASTGGWGTIDYFPLSMTLLVNQTPDVQEQVAALLEKLRRDQDTQVALEVRLVTLPEGFIERIGVDFNKCCGSGACEQCPARVDAQVARDPLKCLPEKTAFLSDKQVAAFLQAVQGDQRSNVMQSPKVTALDGQQVQVDCTDKQFFVTGAEVVQRDGQPVIVPRNEPVVTGFQMTACPRVSADRRFVQLRLNIHQTDLASPAVPLSPVTVEIKDDQGQSHPFTQFIQQPKFNTMCIEKTLSIPDGGTVLLGGLKREVEVRNEFGPPVLSRVPYVSRLFKNVGYTREGQLVYVLVTPRVIVAPEEEPRQTGVIPTTAACKAACTKAAAEAACTEECEACGRSSRPLAELLRAYDRACATGQTEQAARLAQAALILDPTCFAHKQGR
jgi:general secretion pathway protein D